MPRTRRPIHFEPLTGPDAYERLEFFARRFAQGRYNCLVFVGPPGRLKSSIIERIVKGQAHVVSGHATPFEVFCELQQHANELIVIDDADDLYAESTGQRLLKNITNPRKPTSVHWTSDAAVKAGLQKVFTTSSKVCIIDNAWNGQNEHIEALEDRSRLFLFDPPPAAVHRRMADEEWFCDTEIYDFIGDHLFWIKHEEGKVGKGLSVRLYVKALEAKEAGEDWREYILKQYVTGPDLDLLVIEADPYFKGKSVEERCQAWMTRRGNRRGNSRSTYFDHKRQLLDHLASSDEPPPLLGRWTLEQDGGGS
jgi:hypothetical protein